MTIDITNLNRLQVQSEIYLVFREDGENANGIIGAAKRRFKKNHDTDGARASILYNYNDLYYVAVTEAVDINWYVMRVLYDNKDAVDDYLEGDDSVMDDFIDEYIQEARGANNPMSPAAAKRQFEAILETIPSGDAL